MKTIKTIEQKIQEKEKEIKDLKTQLEKEENIIDADKIKWIKVKNFDKEISMPTVWIKPYNEIPIPKGCQLLKISEGFEIFNDEENIEKIGMKGKSIVIPCQQLKADRKNKSSRWLCVDRYSDFDSYGGSLDDSDSDGRVVFRRKK